MSSKEPCSLLTLMSFTVTGFCFLHRSEKTKGRRFWRAGRPQSQRGSQRKKGSGEENGSQYEEEVRLKVGNQWLPCKLIQLLLNKITKRFDIQKSINIKYLHQCQPSGKRKMFRAKREEIQKDPRKRYVKAIMDTFHR